MPVLGQEITATVVTNLVRQAQNAEWATNWAEAKVDFQNAVALDPKNETAQLGLAHCFYHAKDYERAREITRIVVGLNATNEVAQRFLGDCYLRVKDIPSAITAYEKSVELAPMDFEARYWLGMALERMNRYQEAIDVFQKSIEIKPDDFDAHYGRGYTLYKEKRNSEAEEEFRIATKIKPDDFSSKFYLGASLYNDARYKDAAETLQAELQIKPDDFYGHTWLADTWWELGKYQDAATEFKMAARMDPEDFDVRVSAGRMFFYLKKWPEAAEVLEEAHQLRPNDHSNSLKLFRAYLLSAQYLKAARLYPALFISLSVLLGVTYGCGLFAAFRVSLKPQITATPGLIFAIAWIVLFTEGQLVGVAFAGALFSMNQMGVILNAALVVCAAPLFAAVAFGFRKQPWGAPFELKFQNLSLKIIALSVLSGLGLCVVNALVTLAYQTIFSKPFPAQWTVALLKEALENAPVLTVFSTVIIAPLAEEILFRGLLFGALSKFMKPGWVILVTAALFASAHLQAAYFLPILVMGLVLGWARHKTGSLAVSFLIHVINNGLAMLLLSLVHSV